jgi:uncharacterized protein YjaZ
MSTIEELREESDRLYQEQCRAFEAWMDAEADLQVAIDHENELRRKHERAKRFLFFGMIGVGLGMLAAKIFG